MKKALCIILSLFLMLSTLVFAQAAVVENETVILSFDSTEGFSSAFHTGTTIDINEKTEGTGSLDMSFTYPTGQNGGIAGMLFYDYETAQDFSAYDKFKIDIYTPVDMEGKGGRFQVNFVTDSTMQDGYNYDLYISNITTGWNTITFDKSSYADHVNDTDFSNIKRFRLTWFNEEQITRENLILDNLRGSVLTGTPDPHDCTSDGNLQHDETHHWYNCTVFGCNIPVNKEIHYGGEATCNAKAKCSLCGIFYGDVDSTKHVGGTEVRNGSPIYSGDTYCLGCNTMLKQGSAVEPSGTDMGHTPYIVGKDLMINNADSTNGWGSDMFNTTITAGTQIVEGSGSVTMKSTVPRGQANSVGAMTAISFPSTDFTPYEKLQIKFHTSAKLTNSHQIQFNFITGEGEDGYNFGYDVTNLVAGWHTVTVDRLALTMAVSADWRSINRIRITWFNYSQISTKVNFTFDEIMALSPGSHTPYKVGDDLMINNADSTKGWRENMYHTPITSGAQFVEGTGSVTMGCTYPYGQASSIGSMTRLSFTTIDLTPYKSIRYRIHFSHDLPGKHQIQANFITGDYDDGFNHTYTFSDLSAGWHTFTFNKAEEAVEGTFADWSSINAIRFTWFNIEPITTAVSFTFDEIMALSEEHICEAKNDIVIGENDHWYNCKTEGCSNQIDKEDHYGGENTCISVAKCVECGYAYGEIDPENHVNTELRNESENYTGDIWCLDCDTKLKEGQQITETEAFATVATVESSFKAGDEISIPVIITEWSNAYAYITVSMPEYDTNLLRFDGFEASETDFGGALYDSGDKGFVLIACPSNEREATKLLSGEICVMKFTALSKVKKDITVSAEVKANGYYFGSEDNWTIDRPLLIESVNGGIVVPEDDTADVIYGNFDNNDVVDIADALCILQVYTGVNELTEEQAKLCDVDGNGIVDIVDALYVLHYSVGKITSFPVQK